MKIESKDKYSKLKMYSPSMFTTLNLLMGIIVIFHMALNSSNACKIYMPLLILFAGFCDWIDGRVARRFDAESSFGKELDSLADSISFGVAPVTLVVCHLVEYAGILGIIASIMFPLAGVFRLARFNVNEHRGYFEGLPITVAGVALALKHLIVLSLSLQGHAVYIDSYLTSIVMIIVSFLMVSKIKVKKA